MRARRPLLATAPDPETRVPAPTVPAAVAPDTRPWAPYALAGLATAGVTVLAFGLGLGSEPGLFAPFLVAVTAVALAYGPGPALTTLVTSAITTYLGFLAPLSALAFDPSGLRRLTLFPLAVFLACGSVTILLIEWQRRRVDELERSRRQLRSFVANPEVGMQVVDHDGQVTWADDAMHRLLARADGDYVGLAFAAVHADAGLASDVVARLRSGRAVENVRATLRRKDGTVFDVLLSANTLLGDAASPGAGVLVAALPLAPPPAANDGGKLLVACLAERRNRAATSPAR